MDSAVAKSCKTHIYDIRSWHFIKHSLRLINTWVVCLQSEKRSYVKAFRLSLSKFRVTLVDEVIRFKLTTKIADKLKCNKLLYNTVSYPMCRYKRVPPIESSPIPLGDEWLMLTLWCLYHLHFHCRLPGRIPCLAYQATLKQWGNATGRRRENHDELSSVSYLSREYSPRRVS